MADETPAAYTLPTALEHPFDPNAGLARLRDTEPVARLAYPDGHLGWLVTKPSIARKVLTDPRFSARRELLHAPVEPPDPLPPGPARPGWMSGMDPPEHTGYRELVTAQFSIRRLTRLEPPATESAESLLDEIELAGPPADLVEAYALPIPPLVIGELLGVPERERDEVRSRTQALTRPTTGTDQAVEIVRALREYVHRLVGRKRAHPGDDVLSGLAAGGRLTDEELANIGTLLLVTGHETTARMIAHGVFALLCHPAQLEKVKADPASADRAVEELIRYLAVVEAGVSRAALEDVELEGRPIKKGETVTVWISAANRDPEVFEDPDVLNLERTASGHLSFGYGIHECVGQQLARLELRVAYSCLFNRFPSLRLAVPAGEVPLRAGVAVHMIESLPVTW
ncbi:MAG TPA: cytochrome P450 [Actinocrinis sp.]|nr:cytochrome P450 [Actinocrinis sp.]